MGCSLDSEGRKRKQPEYSHERLGAALDCLWKVDHTQPPPQSSERLNILDVCQVAVDAGEHDLRTGKCETVQLYMENSWLSVRLEGNVPRTANA